MADTNEPEDTPAPAGDDAPEAAAPQDAPEAPADDELDPGFDDELDLDAERPPTTKAVRMAQIGLVVAAVLILIVVLLVKGGGDDDKTASKDDKTETTTADGKKASDVKTWPKDVEGRPPALGKTNQKPAASTKAKPGVYIWSDFDGWHLWTVNGEGVPAISGTLTSNDAVQKAVLAVPDAGTVDINDKVVTFSFPTTPAVVGMDFNPGFYGNKLVITVNGPDGPLDASKVFLGKKSVPAPFPIVLEKEVQD